MYKVEFKGLTGVLKKISGILGLSLWELLMSLPHRTPGGIYLSGFWILCQDFWAHHVISTSNQRERESLSFTHPYTGITILLTQQFHHNRSQIFSYKNVRFFFLLHVMNDGKLLCVQKHITCNERPLVVLKNWS